MIRIVILAPALALRAGLRAILAADEQLEVIAEGAALTDLEELPPGTDVVVSVAEALVLEDIEDLIEESSAPPAILLMTDELLDARAFAELPLRAWGLLAMDASEEELIAAIHSLHQGLITAAPALIQPLLGEVMTKDVDADLLVDELTGREMEVLDLLSEGLANKQIALELEISEHTVKFHVSSIYTKLGATNRTEAVRIGARLGLIVF